MGDALVGALFIGDPHVSSRVPGFRKDDYPRVGLGKLRWCLDYAATERLLPVILGDLFHWPRDNANWLLGELIALLAGRGAIGIVGNHDTTERGLTADDSLAVLVAAGSIRLVDQSGPWRGTLNGRSVMVGGTSWSSPLPASIDREERTLAIWLSHHNVGFPDEEEGWLKPHSIPGVDILLNGHIHTPRPDVVCDETTWMNPGNITRVQRADSVREARPSVLRLDIGGTDAGWSMRRIEVPHEPFDAVFHEVSPGATETGGGSAFVRGLEDLQSLRTTEGAGLMAFIHANIELFEPNVAEEILSLAKEACGDEQTES